MSPDQNPDVTVPLDRDQVKEWHSQIDKAREQRKRVERWWDANLRAYAPMPTGAPDDYGQSINTNRDFTLVERKKADLFFQCPDVTAIPSPLFQGQEPLIEAHTLIINEKLGPEDINALDLCHRTLFDVLCTSGMGWTVMGYESATVPVPMEQPQTQPGAILNINPVTPPVSAPVPVWEHVYWRHISPKQGLIPEAARSTDHETWPWIGYDVDMPVRSAKRLGWVDERFAGGHASADIHFDYGFGTPTGSDVVRVTVIYYKSSLFRDDRAHPLHQTRLIFVEGQSDPVEHKDSPYQELDAQGRLTADSLIGWPVHPCSIRFETDTAYVPSDCTVSRPLVSELNKFREQMIEQRETTLLRYQYNVDTLPPDALEKIVKSPIGGFIGVPGEAFVGDGAIKEIPHGTYPRENFEFNNFIDNDLARTHAIDADQAGASQAREQTASEAQIKQSNVGVRMGLERNRFLLWYLQGYTKFSQIAMRLLPIEDAQKIVGPQKAQLWDQWRKQVPAKLAFTALPDSTLRMDLASDRKRLMDGYTFFANDPFVDRPSHLKYIFPRLGLPESLVVPQAPAPHPPEPKTTIAVRTEDMSPLSPAYPNVFQLLTQMGIQNLTPPLQPPPQPPPGPPMPGHGGKVAQMESLSKHQVDQTGGMQGSGAPAPMGAGGRVQ